MPYNPNQPFTYGIPDGTYVGKPVTASCFEKDGRLILDINFEVKDPKTGQWYKKDNGYNWEAKKRNWLTSKDGAFNQATINGIKEWAKGWNPQGLDDFWWFQQPDANGMPFGNLAAIGEVELNFATDKDGNQTIWVHDPDRPKSGGRKAFVPDGASADMASIKAKWGTRAKALFASTPKKVATASAPAAPQAAPAAPAHPSSDRQGGSLRSGDIAAGVVAPPAAPTRPAAAPARPAAAPASAKPWAEYPQTCDGAFAFYCALLKERRKEDYSSEKHDAEWFEIFDGARQGKDPDEFTPADVQRLMEAVDNGVMPF